MKNSRRNNWNPSLMGLLGIHLVRDNHHFLNRYRVQYSMYDLIIPCLYLCNHILSALAGLALV